MHISSKKKKILCDLATDDMTADNMTVEFLFFPLGDGFIGLTIDGGKSKLFILNDTTSGVLEIPFSNLLQFHPMGETQDHDGKINAA